MRVYALPLLVSLALIANACGSDGQSGDAGRDAGDAGSGKGGGGGRGGTNGGAGRGGTGGSVGGDTGEGGAGTGGSVGGSTGDGGAGTGGSTAGTGGSTAGTGGSTGTGPSGGRGGATAGTGGSAAGTGGAAAGSGGSTGTGGATAGTGGATAGTGGSTGAGGATAGAGGSSGTGGSTAGTGGVTGTGGSTAGTGGAAGATGGSGGATGGSSAGSTGTGGATGSAGTGGATGSAGTGGGGIACTSASTCPGGADSECQHKTCINNTCGLDFTAANTPVFAQTAGDCHRNVCDGVGGIMPAILDSDTPPDDGNACTDETCVNGIATHPSEPAHTSCAQSGGSYCNGSASAPACVVCVLAADCPGTDTACHRRICGNQNTCGFANEPAGSPGGADATGNCRKAVCDDMGGITSTPDDTDVPADDGNPCTDDVCASGAPSHPTKPDGTACTGPNGGKWCSGAACVQCLAKADCPGTDTLCRQFVCQNDHTCGHVDAQAGTAAGTDATGNCHKSVCDGAGAVISAVDDTDKLVDGNSCTSDVCTNGTPTNPNLPAGTLCTTTASPPDGSKVCDGSAGCNPITFRVVRVGDGSAALSDASTRVYVEERKLDGSLVDTVALPISANGTQKALTVSGSATSEGALSLSSDGRYLALAGYAIGPGTNNVASTTAATVNRVAARIDIAGTMDTSTTFALASSGNNIRSAATTDGSEFWVAGAGGATSGGVWYKTLGAAGSEPRVVSTPNNVRVLAIFGDQLYGSSDRASYSSVFSIGFGTPTVASQTATVLSGLPTSGASPFAYALVDDTSNNVSGLDTLYIALDNGGLQKWTRSGTTWSQPTTTPTLNIAGNAGFRGVAAYAVGGTVTLMATTAEDSANRLVVFVDDGVNAPTGTTVFTAGANTALRGVALSPHFAAP